MSKKLDLVGQRFGRLVVLHEDGRDKWGYTKWRCKCDCSAEVTVRGYTLRNGATQSCGCLRIERTIGRSTTHGMCNTRLYRVWTGMLTRVGVYKGADEEAKRNYKDRGITVCDEWHLFEPFKDWALSHGYSEGLQIDRIDNACGYCPENCRWVSPRENINNRRCTLRLSDGTTLADFCRNLGIETCSDNRKSTKQYARYQKWFRRHNGQCHPDLITKANETICIMRKCLEMRKILKEVRALRASL